MSFKNIRVWLLIILIPAAFGLGMQVRPGSSPAEDGHDHKDSNPQRWTCSMHPQIILPSNDQQCPICFMDLIPLEEDNNSGLNPNELSLSDAAAALADVGTSTVQRRFVSRRVPLVGKVSVDETRQREISARFGGRLDRLYMATTGVSVKRGMKLAEIYSPEIYSAQSELRSATKALDEASGSASASRLVDSAKRRLRLLGLDSQQIEKIAHGDDFEEHLTVVAPFDGVIIRRVATEGQYIKTGSVLYSIADLSSVWVTLEAYERDLQWLSMGQNVSFSIRSNPGMEFTGEILFLDPVLNEKTRTVEVRVQVDNKDGLLKPGMLVSAEVEAVLDASGLPADPDQVALPPLVVPVSAPLLTGRRAVVYVKLPDQEEPVYQGRIVTLGPRAGEYYLVNDGLFEGEEVVTRGAFKIDSALQILARPSMMMAPEISSAVHEQSSGLPAIDANVLSEDFKEDLAAVLKAYLQLQKMLAEDENSGSALAATALSEAMSEAHAKSTSLPVSVVMQWDELYAPINRTLHSMLKTTDLASRRVQFQPLSDNLWLVLEKFGTPENQIVRRFNCPMAFDNAGADWIQLGKTTNNPYYGEMMLRCGSEVGTIGQDGE